MNRELMLKVADVIEEYPEKYDQGCWIGNKAGDYYGPSPKPTKADYHRCGTVCCIAGHAVMQGILAGTRPEMPKYYWRSELYFNWQEEAAKDLGISDGIAGRLFDADFEPTIPVPEFLRKLADADTEERQLKILETYA